MQRLASLAGLMVQQQKEWGEIVTGFETKNKYVVRDPSGNQLYFAAEEKGSLLARLFLKASRPFHVAVLDTNSNRVISVRRPFRFFFHEATVTDSNGTVLGKIKKNFSLIRRKYVVLDAHGRETFQLYGPLLKPWTFMIREGNNEIGKISKEWSGLLKESFSDADNFGVEFPSTWQTNQKALFLGAVFLIDFVHFENKSGG